MTHNNWPTVKLGNLITRAKSQTAGSKEYPVLSMTMEHGMVLQKERFKKRIAGKNTEKYKVVENGQLVVGFPIDEGVLDFQTLVQAGIVSPAYKIWELKDSSVCNLNYLRRYLRSNIAISYYRARLQGTTARRRSLTDQAFLQLPVPLPPLEEQRRIAEMLDATSRMIETTKTVEDNLENFAKAAYSEFFSGFESPEVLLTEVGKSKDAIKCGPFGTQLKQADFQTQGVPLIGIKSVNSRFELSPWEFLAREKAEQLASYDVRPGDILMTRKGTIGNCSLYPRSLPHGIMHSDLLRIRVDNPHINPVFLLHQLHYDHGIQSQIRKLSPGAVMPGINVGKLKKLKIRVPPIEFQERFAKVIQASDQTRAIVRAKLKALIELQASLYARAFNGKL
mgnify:CR=1 FL=1